MSKKALKYFHTTEANIVTYRRTGVFWKMTVIP